MRNKLIQHVFFDLDHTLWDFDKNSSLTFQKIFDIHRIGVSLDNFIEVYEPINLHFWKLYREERISKPDLRYRRLKDAFDALDFNISDATINQLSEDYITYLTTFNHLFEDAFEILEYLKPKYQLHIITNGFEEAQTKKLEASGLKQFFKSITNSEQAGVKKPNPYIFEYALNAAEASPHNSVMIGDSLEADVYGALNAKMDAIFFNYRNEEFDSELNSVDTLKEIMTLL